MNQRYVKNPIEEIRGHICLAVYHISDISILGLLNKHNCDNMTHNFPIWTSKCWEPAWSVMHETFEPALD